MKMNNPNNGVFFVYNDQDKLYPVFCGFSEPGFAWTLIESFSLGNKGPFSTLPFWEDNEFNENSMQWSKYRLSLSRMMTIASPSTHVKATCNFPATNGLPNRDYFRAGITELDIFKYHERVCAKYDIINIRGIECQNCTAGTHQYQSEHLHINSYGSKQETKCQFDGNTMVAWEQNFGRYTFVNPLFSCTSSDTSTTQYWFGGVITN
jgi:hypothetical protein